MPDERIPPHSEEAERSVLGAAIQNEAALNVMAEMLLREDFYDPAHAQIFDALLSLYRDRRAADLTTVADALKRNGALEFAGGHSYLAEISAAVPSPSNAYYYGEIVREKAKLRSLIESAGEIIAQGYSEGRSADEVLESAEQSILAIGQRGQGRDFIPLLTVLTDNMREMEIRSQNEGKLTGLPTGFDRLDDITLGLQKSDLVIIAARPGMGKTSLALNIAANAAKQADASVMIFSLEMNCHLLGERLLSSEAEVDSKQIRDGSVVREKDKMGRIGEANETLGRSRIHIDDNPSISIAEMKNKCRRLKATEGLDLIIVDYLQLMDFGGNGRASARPENRQQEISTLSRMLKQLARDMDCPTVVLSQLSREVEKRGSRRPVLADLRESGAIEQDADVVLFIYQEERKNEEESGPDPETTRRIIVAKHRNGETGDFTLRWVGNYTKFGNYNPADDLHQFI